MSGDSKEQPNIFYTKGAPLLTAESLLQEGKVKSLYRMADEPEKVYIHFHLARRIPGHLKMANLKAMVNISG